MSAEFAVVDHDNDNRRTFTSRSEAEDAAETVRELGSSNVEVVAPNDDSDGTDETTETDGGPEVVDDAPDTDHEPEVMPSDKQNEANKIPDDPNLTDDPFTWMPGDFVDTIDGTPTINRRGYAALGRKFDISAPDITVHVGPEETDHTFCRVEARVVDSDGREFVNHGSASVERGDTATLLLELAVTRARKRALAGATGVGLIAVEELKNEL